MDHSRVAEEQQATHNENFHKNVCEQGDSRIIRKKQGNMFDILHESSGLNFIAPASDKIQNPIMWYFLEQVKQYSTSWKNTENYGIQQEFRQK